MSSFGLATTNMSSESLTANAPHLNVNAGPAGAITYWHVDDVHATLDRLISLGAKELEGIKERGEGFVTASVVDPFGNVLGIMYNKHYLEVVSRQ